MGMSLYCEDGQKKDLNYVFAVRGTVFNRLKDLCADFELAMGKVPSRIGPMLVELANVICAVENGAKIKVVGHSLGGNLSLLLVCAIHLRKCWEKDGFAYPITRRHQDAIELAQQRLEAGDVTVTSYAYNPGVSPLSLYFYLWKLMSLRDRDSGQKIVLKPEEVGVIPPLQDCSGVVQKRYHIYRVKRDPVSFNVMRALFGFDRVKDDSITMIQTESCRLTTLPSLDPLDHHTVANFLCSRDYEPLIKGTGPEIISTGPEIGEFERRGFYELEKFISNCVHPKWKELAKKFPEPRPTLPPLPRRKTTTGTSRVLRYQ